jgi:hypothetical protein
MDREPKMKACPYCSAEIHEAAIVCSYCGRDLLNTVPMNVALSPKVQEQAKKINSILSYVIVGLFIVFSIACVIGFYTLLLNT